MDLYERGRKTIRDRSRRWPALRARRRGRLRGAPSHGRGCPSRVGGFCDVDSHRQFCVHRSQLRRRQYHTVSIDRRQPERLDCSGRSEPRQDPGSSRILFGPLQRYPALLVVEGAACRPHRSGRAPRGPALPGIGARTEGRGPAGLLTSSSYLETRNSLLLGSFPSHRFDQPASSQRILYTSWPLTVNEYSILGFSSA